MVHFIISTSKELKKINCAIVIGNDCTIVKNTSITLFLVVLGRIIGKIKGMSDLPFKACFLRVIMPPR